MKILKWTLLGLLALILLLVVFLAASVGVDAILGRDRLDAVTNLTIPGQDGGLEVRAYLAKPAGDGPFPAVILIHEFFGLNESIVGKAQALADEGYLVVAPDTFRGATTSWIPRGIYQVVTTRPERVNQDLDAVTTWLEQQPDVDASRVAVAGFCYGGGVSLNYSLHNPRLAATVVFYGAPVTDAAVLKTLPGPLLGIFGGADPTIPRERVKAFQAALDQAGIANEITIYENQPHAFVTDMAAVQAGGAAGAAWAEMLRFLEGTLKQGEALHPAGQPSAYQAPFAWRYYLALAYEHAFGSAGHLH